MPDDLAIRPAVVEDAPALLRFLHRLDEETDTLLLEPGERTESEAVLASRLARTEREDDGITLIALVDDRPVGYLEATGSRLRRNAHVAWLALGVRPAFQGRGIGARLLGDAEAWARACGVTRLELTVMAHNAAAIRLYERAGFEREGLRRRALQVRGEYVDEHYMAKLL